MLCAHYLVRMRKVILTKNTELSLRYTLRRFNLQNLAFQTWQCRFSKRRKVTNQFTKKQKGPLVATQEATETLISLRTRFVVALP